MKIYTTTRLICFAVLLFAAKISNATGIAFTDGDAASIKTFLHENFDHTNSGMVIGLLDEHGTRIFSAGNLDNGTSQKVDADTVFEIGSITKTFTVLLLEDMVTRGQMKLEDPVAKYLPKTVRMPTYHGKEITLRNLAAQESGLPFNPDNLLEKQQNPWTGYTAEKMYEFLARATLKNEPGAKFQYSNIGMALLGHVIALKAGTNYESLVLERICRPLHMDSTRVALTPELQALLARGHRTSGKPAVDWNLGAAVGCGGLRSTVNDLLKYVSANLGIVPSKLNPLMQQMQVQRHNDLPGFGKTRMPWYDQMAYAPEMELLGHGGGTRGFSTFIGFDRKQRRGIVVLSNQTTIHSSITGWRILQNANLAGLNAATMVHVREMVGTGIAFGPDKETHLIKITKVYPDSCAARAGLSTNLLIQKIEGVSTLNKSVEEALDLFRANGAATVRLELVDVKKKETNTIQLARGKLVMTD
jgi:CubicO group peptidase (beta-lactamase class C family)